MTKRTYRVVFTEEDGVYCMAVPSLPGCFSEGRTLDEAKEMIAEAIGCYLDDEEGDFPDNAVIDEAELEENSFILPIEYDKDEYDRKFNTFSPVVVNLPVYWADWLKGQELDLGEILVDRLIAIKYGLVDPEDL